MKKHSSGFTLVEMLLSFMIYIIIVFSLPILFKILSEWTTPKVDFNVNEWEVFIAQSEKEINESQAVNVSSKVLKFTKYNGEIVTYEQYEDKVRRKVNGRGYEILLQNINSITFIMEHNGVTIICSDKQNNVYKERISALPDIMVTSS